MSFIAKSFTAPVHLESTGIKPSSEEDAVIFHDGKRLETLKQTVHVAIVWAVRVASISMLLLFVFRVYHLAAPECCVWISPERQQKIDSLLFSGSVGAFIARYLNQAMPASKSSKYH